MQICKTLKIWPNRVGESEEWDTSRMLVTPDNRTSFQIKNLQPFTIYSFRVLAKNAIGTSNPSDSSFNMITLRECKLNTTMIRIFIVLHSSFI